VKPSSMVYTMAGLKEIETWMSIYWDQTKNIWKGSIRSRSVDVREIAKGFGGGGHKLASGFSLANKNDIKKVIELVK
jgi:phosphoesterase RecJ-like protein